MNPSLHNEVLPRLLRDYQFKVRESHGKKSLRQGECPSCNKKELYAFHDDPWVLRCGRLNKCGAEFHIKDLYPDLFTEWSTRHPVTPENPNAAADAYLRDGRGFSLDMVRGWYTQENYWDRTIEQGSATVRFAITSQVWWERIIDKPNRFGSRKATFRGEYKGLWWNPPSGIGIPDELWIVEGIFDAIALMHHGITAVAAMSSVNYPSTSLAALAEQCKANGKERPRLVWALDGDKSGREYTLRHSERSSKDGWETTAATIPQTDTGKLDWNDMHQRGRLQEHNLDLYRYEGSLLLAKSATEKALLMYSRHGWNTFAYDFDNRLWWWKLDVDRYNKVRQEKEAGEHGMEKEEAIKEALQQSHSVTEICNCLPRPLYYMKNHVTGDAWYYFLITFPHDGETVKTPFTSSHLNTSSEFKKRLMHDAPGSIWKGNDHQLTNLLSRWIYNPKIVKTIDFIGYSIEHGTYVFNDVAVKDGQVVEINDEDYFPLGKLAIKSLSKTPSLEINTDLKAHSEDWFHTFYTAYGAKGIVLLAYWMGTLFAEQIRDRFESYPFLELVGEPGAGKTTLLETLWKLVGRVYEGFDPTKGSQIGVMRSMSQIANLPVVLIESESDKDGDGSRGRPRQDFDWNRLKSLFNGGSLRTTGIKSNSNDTYDPQFRAALVISQNDPVKASLPIMERIVHVWLDKSRLSQEGKEASRSLNRMEIKHLSGWLLKAVTQEAKVLELMEKQQPVFEQRIEGIGVGNQRLQKNHAQIMVMVHALSYCTPITDAQKTEAVRLLADMAKQREQDIASDHPTVDRFWEAYEYLNGGNAKGELAEGEEALGANDEGGIRERINHSRNPEIIAINLNHFMQVASEFRQPVPDLHDLHKFLKTSRRYKFIDIGNVNSAINARFNIENPSNKRPASVKCWRFKAK